MPRPRAPFSSAISASMVGLPRESKHLIGGNGLDFHKALPFVPPLDLQLINSVKRPNHESVTAAREVRLSKKLIAHIATHGIPAWRWIEALDRRFASRLCAEEQHEEEVG